MKWFIGKKVLAAGLMLALAILVGIAIALYKNTLRLIETGNLVAKTHETLHELEDTYSVLKDAEIGARGYIITGENHYLEPYHAAIKAIDKEIRHIRELTSDNPMQQQKLDSLESLIAEKLVLLKRKIDLRKKEGFKAALELTLTDTGEKITYAIRMKINEIENIEKELLKIRNENSKASTKRAYLTLLVGTSISFVILLIVFYFLIHEVTERKIAEEGLRKAHDELEKKVQERTAELAETNEALQVEVAERKRAEEILRCQRNELGVRARILATIIGIKDLNGLLNIILNEIIEFLNVEFGIIHLVRGNKVLLSHWQGISDEFRSNVLFFTIDSVPDIIRKPHIVHERLSEQGLMPEFAKSEGIQAWASIPLKLHLSGKNESEEWLGTIVVCSRSYEVLKEDNVHTLERFADQMALAIDHVRSYRQAQERLARLQVLREIDKAIIQNIEVLEVLHVVLERIPNELGADAAAISLLDEEQLRMEVFAFRFPNGTIIDKEAFSIADSLLHWFINRQEIVIIYDLTKDPRVQMNREYVRNGNLISYLGVPLIVFDKTIGVLHILTTKPKVFEDEDVEFFRTMAGQTAIALQNAKARDKLRESEKKYRTLAENLPGIVYRVFIRENNRMQFFNRAAESITGYTDEELTSGDICSIAPLIVSEDRTKVVAEMERAIAEKKPFKVEYRLTHKDGSIRYMLEQGTPIYGADGEPLYIDGIFFDITEERENEMRLIMNERLASLGQMASGIAHEINNPLASISGCTEGLLSRLKKGHYDPVLFEDYLKIMKEEIFRCKNITTNMLSFVKEKTFEQKEININELLTKSLEIIDFQGRLKRVRVINNLSDELPVIFGNEGELRQVFMTMLTNAIDAMEEKGTLTVSTGVEANTGGNKVIIKISDTGSGILPEHISRIFEPFFTTKTESGGTGLGLSIARKIIQNHNGSIDVVSEKGVGTTFKITLQ